MTNPAKSKIAFVWPSPEVITAIAGEAVRDACRMHKKLGIPIVIGDENGRAVEIAPEDIDIPDESTFSKPSRV